MLSKSGSVDSNIIIEELSSSISIFWDTEIGGSLTLMIVKVNDSSTIKVPSDTDMIISKSPFILSPPSKVNCNPSINEIISSEVLTDSSNSSPSGSIADISITNGSDSKVV